MSSAPVLLLYGTMAFGYLVSAILVGIAWGVILGHVRRAPGPIGTTVILLAVFVILDLYWWPALIALDASVTIGNEATAKILDVPVNTRISISTLLDVGRLDLLAEDSA